MVTQKEIKDLLRERYPYLVSEFGVKRIGMFGSSGKNVPRKSSDIDIVVEFERPIGFRFVEFVEYLENLLGRKVDVLTPAGIQGIRIPHIAKDIEESIVYV
jgi:hypothetical protein